MSAMEC